MSVRRNVEYPLRIAKVPRAQRRERAMEALATVRLDGDGRPVTHGAVGRAAPAGGAGPRAGRAPVRAPARRAARRARPQAARADAGRAASRSSGPSGITFVLVTHDQDEALTLADRIVVFDAGRVEQVGPGARGLRAARRRAFVAGFVGTSNLLRPDAAHALLGRDGSGASVPRRSASPVPPTTRRRTTDHGGGRPSARSSTPVPRRAASSRSTHRTGGGGSAHGPAGQRRPTDGRPPSAASPCACSGAPSTRSRLAAL